MKRIFGSVVALLLCTTVFAQLLKEPPKTLKNYGVSGIMWYDLSVIPFYESDGDEVMAPMLTLYTGSYGIRKSIYTIDDHTSIGLVIEPSIGFAYLPELDIRTEFPIMVGINKGAAATYRSISTRGFAWNVGVNLQNGPIVNHIMFAEDGVKTALMPRMMLCTSLHFRSWNTEVMGDGDCREVELFFATRLGKQPDALAFEVAENFELATPMRLSMYFRRFLKY